MFQHRHKQVRVYCEWTYETQVYSKRHDYTCSEFSHAPFNLKSFSAAYEKPSIEKNKKKYDYVSITLQRPIRSIDR